MLASEAASRRRNKVSGATDTEVATTEMFNLEDMGRGAGSEEAAQSDASSDSGFGPLPPITSIGLGVMAIKQSITNQVRTTLPELQSTNNRCNIN